jgi:hypothetical protein
MNPEIEPENTDTGIVPDSHYEPDNDDFETDSDSGESGRDFDHEDLIEAPPETVNVNTEELTPEQIQSLKLDEIVDLYGEQMEQNGVTVENVREVIESLSTEELTTDGVNELILNVIEYYNL